jgi:hypothetical protein
MTCRPRGEQGTRAALAVCDRAVLIGQSVLPGASPAPQPPHQILQHHALCRAPAHALCKAHPPHDRERSQASADASCDRGPARKHAKPFSVGPRAFMNACTRNVSRCCTSASVRSSTGRSGATASPRRPSCSSSTCGRPHAFPGWLTTAHGFTDWQRAAARMRSGRLTTAHGCTDR